MTSTLHRTPLATAGLALVVALGGCGGGGGDSRETPPYVPKATTVDATTPAPAAEPLTIASPMFADGAPIPVQFSCKGANVAPPLTWSSPAGAAELALVVDDPDAVGGLYVHWIVTGRPWLWQHGGWSDSCWWAQRAEFWWSARILRSMPAGGHRDTPLPVYPLPPSCRAPAATGSHGSPSGTGDSTGRQRTGPARRHIRRLTPRHPWRGGRNPGFSNCAWRQ